VFVSSAICFGWAIAIFLFGFGAINLFFKDIAWELQERANRNRGIVDSERTPQWETQATITGIGVIIFSIALALMIYTRP
jgi:hypothetical protein